MVVTREGAVKGLRNVADWHYGKYEQTHEEDYLNDGDFLTAVANMLKEQAPKVMTLEEVKAAAGHDVWIELSGNIADDVLFATTIEGCGTKGLCTRYESLNYSAYGIRPYGWRCWTSRPTDEQREATPWNS